MNKQKNVVLMTKDVMEELRQGRIDTDTAIEQITPIYLEEPKPARIHIIVAVNNYPIPEGGDAFNWLRQKTLVAQGLQNKLNEQESKE